MPTAFTAAMKKPQPRGFYPNRLTRSSPLIPMRSQTLGALSASNELTFSMLNAYMRQLRRRFGGDFGGILRYEVAESGSDKKEHFQYSAGRLYRFEGDLEAFQ